MVSPFSAVTRRAFSVLIKSRDYQESQKKAVEIGDDGEALSVMEGCYILIPQERPILKSAYICDKVFHLDYIKKLIAPQEYYGGILLSQKESRFYLINDVETRLLEVVRNSVPKKQKKGGQSAARIGRARQGKRSRNCSHLAERLLHHYWDSDLNDCRVLGLIIGGPAETKDEVMSDDLFQKNLKTHVILVENTPEIQGGTLEDLYEKSKSGGQLQKHHQQEEMDVLQLISDLQLGHSSRTGQKLDDDLLAYGWQEITNGLKDCLLGKVIFTKTGPKTKEIRQLLKQLDYQPEIIELQTPGPCDELDRNYGGLIGIKWY